MSSELFEFVSESVLFDRGQIERQYRNLSEDELERELKRFRGKKAKGSRKRLQVVS